MKTAILRVATLALLSILSASTLNAQEAVQSHRETPLAGGMKSSTDASTVPTQRFIPSVPKAASASQTVFTNPAEILISPVTGTASAAARPYPSEITVSGLQTFTTKVTVTLNNLTHTFPNDIDVLLVGPLGQKCILMSDAGGGNDVADITLTFDNDATANLPVSTIITSGTYRPTNFTSGDVFPAPAPTTVFGDTLLTSFTGIDPNGVWKLYVFDDLVGDTGRIAGGWSIDVTAGAPPSNDAGVTALVSPTLPFAAGSQSVSVTVKNFGASALSSVVVNWSVNGAVQSPVPLTFGTPVAPDATAPTALGNFNFPPGSYTLKAWTTLPNGSADGNALNDTLLTVPFGPVFPAGAYSIAAAGTFTTFTQAVAALAAGGVSGTGNVVFSVAAGSYPERFTISPISGASATNRIVFQATPGTVTLNGLGTAAPQEGAVTLDRADFITFDGIDVTDGGTTTTDQVEVGYLLVATPTDGNQGVIIKNATVTTGGGGTVSLNSAAVIQSSGTATAISGASIDNTFDNIKPIKTHRGIVIVGTTAFPNNNIQILNCVIGSLTDVIGSATSSTFLPIGILVTNTDAVTIRNNRITNVKSASTTTGGATGIAAQLSSGEITQNQIIDIASLSTANTATIIGIQAGASVAGGVLIANNFISNIASAEDSPIAADSLPRAVGINTTLFTGGGATSVVSVVNNTVSLSAAATAPYSSAAVLSRFGGTYTVQNNLLVNTAGGTAAPAAAYGVFKSGSTPNAQFTSNQNDLFVSGTNASIGKYNADVAVDLAAWQTASGQDAASISKEVNFVSASDLHLTGASLGDVQLAVPQLASVTTDIDGEARRNPTYMGADEGSIQVPVELASFEGRAVGNAVSLTWKTASEKNNERFEVEKSADGKAFSMIGSVKGNGTTTESKSYNFTDNSTFTGASVFYRLKQIDYDGKFEVLPTIEVKITKPETFSLSQNYPNPFNPSTVIAYSLPKQELVSIKIYDLTGREVQTLVNGRQDAGRYSVSFNAARLASGVYFYRLQAGNFTETRKMMLVK